MNLGIGNIQGGTGNSGGGSKSSSIFGRVVEVLLDSSHPRYAELGNTQALNGVFYRELTRNISEKDAQVLNFAYTSNTNISITPVENEIIEIEFLPSENRENYPNILKAYWTRIIPLWNHSHHNAYPDTKQFKEQASGVYLGKYFKESNKIKPLQRIPGDIVIEGRHGQSLRFGGSTYKPGTVAVTGNSGDAYTILRNGQADTKQDISIEDVNADGSSLYLVDNHIVPLKQASTNLKAWRQAPEDSSKYKGMQALLTSKRVIINAKDEHLLLLAKKGIGLSGDTVAISAGAEITLDAKKVYLGQAAMLSELEPVLLGESTTQLLGDLIGKLEQLLVSLSSLSANPVVAIPVIISNATALQKAMPGLRTRLKGLKSKKVFTE